LGQWDTCNNWTQRRAETPRYAEVLFALQRRCPVGIDDADWQQAITDFTCFLEKWAEQGDLLGWTAEDLLGLAPVPAQPSPSFQRLSRYDLTGLIWLLHGRPVVALTSSSAAIQGSSGAVTIYRKNNKPSPLGDSVDDFDKPQFAGGADPDVV
jgi:hypothetical protein